MEKIEKVIKGIEKCIAIPGMCRGCPYEKCDEVGRQLRDCSTDVLRDALELLKAQPKWIPVTERKPKSMANKVIVYVEHEDLNPQIGYGHYEKFQGVEMWYNLETQEQFSEHGYTVTHWMPMPKSLDGKRLILD